jgi:hypothetical protein
MQQSWHFDCSYSDSIARDPLWEATDSACPYGGPSASRRVSIKSHPTVVRASIRHGRCNTYICLLVGGAVMVLVLMTVPKDGSSITNPDPASGTLDAQSPGCL